MPSAKLDASTTRSRVKRSTTLTSVIGASTSTSRAPATGAKGRRASRPPLVCRPNHRTAPSKVGLHAALSFVSYDSDYFILCEVFRVENGTAQLAFSRASSRCHRWIDALCHTCAALLVSRPGSEWVLAIVHGFAFLREARLPCCVQTDYRTFYLHERQNNTFIAPSALFFVLVLCCCFFVHVLYFFSTRVEELPRGLDDLPGFPQRHQAQVWLEGAEGKSRDGGERQKFCHAYNFYFM